MLFVLLGLLGCRVAVEPMLPFEGTDYAFLDENDQSTVVYTGQTLRHLLIHDLNHAIENLDQRVASETLTPSEVATDLLYYLDSVKEFGDVAHQYSSDMPIIQSSYAQVSEGKNLFEKLAGNDAGTDHQNWSQDFVGWEHEDVYSPQSLVEYWVWQLDRLATSGDNVSLDSPIYVTPEGQNLALLMEYFLLGAVAYSQALDDYLDDDVAEKGLLSSHLLEEGENYSALMHAWDEAYGYFGAASNYPEWTPTDIVDVVAMDGDGDQRLNLYTEVNWGPAIQMAHRDIAQGSTWHMDIWQHFAQGRHLLQYTVGEELEEADFQILLEHRNAIALLWEKSLVSSMIHSLNLVIQHLEDTDAEQSVLIDDWSRMKGVALSLQFAPRSLLNLAEIGQIHDLIGQSAPHLEDLDDNMMQNLLNVKSIVAEAYGFTDSEMGDDHGQNGW